MEIVGYYIHGAKEYVAFSDGEKNPARFKITDGFHDRPVTRETPGSIRGTRR